MLSAGGRGRSGIYQYGAQLYRPKRHTSGSIREPEETERPLLSVDGSYLQQSATYVKMKSRLRGTNLGVSGTPTA